MTTSGAKNARPQGPSIRDDMGNAILLVILYMVQGIPLGLSMGSMPFLMSSTMSYTKIGIFSLAAYPYSFKLLWSPLVDTIYSKTIGRRKSWIIPLQTLAAAVMIGAGGWVESRLALGDAAGVTALFFVLVLLAATQDIAVDGWALTLLSPPNVGYAATCQTVGMNIGYFTSFTVFLALSDPEFCSAYLGTAPGVPAVTLTGYMRFWGWAYLVVTAGVALFNEKPAARRQAAEEETGNGAPAAGVATQNGGAKENAASEKAVSPAAIAARDFLLEEEEGELLRGRAGGRAPTRRRSQRLAAAAAAAAAEALALPPPSAYSKEKDAVERPWDSPGAPAAPGPPSTAEEEEDLREAYAQLWRVVKLPCVRLLAVLLMVARLGMLAAESAAPLKLLEKGVSKEALAGLVLVEFPVELLSALVAGRWAASSHPLRPYFTGYRLRLTLAGATAAMVWAFPSGAAALGDAPLAFGALAALGVATSFASTLMFTALGDFFNRVSDPAMGGAYLTLLNTLANVGVVVPKLAAFAAMDFLTARRCADVGGAAGSDTKWLEAACGPASAAGAADGSCTAAGGTCVVTRDGFYVLTAGSVVLGLGIGVWMRGVLARLEATPPAEWRAPPPPAEARKKRA